MRRSTRQCQAATAASTKHSTASASPINLISAIRACPAAPAEILAALDQIEQVLLDCCRIYTLPDCNLDLKGLESLLLANPGKILFLHPPDYGTAINNVLLQSPTNQQPFKLWVVLVPSDPTATSLPLIPCLLLNPWLPRWALPARICFVKRLGDLSVIPSGYPHV
ncbi:hypothetical protein BDR26DRAFT_943375 [Obelidium mucronatum]|nr:hypothetical protein BDR26DRAFT_943375 [Obelidium mucronatum]